MPASGNLGPMSSTGGKRTLALIRQREAETLSDDGYHPPFFTVPAKQTRTGMQDFPKIHRLVHNEGAANFASPPRRNTFDFADDRNPGLPSPEEVVAIVAVRAGQMIAET